MYSWFLYMNNWYCYHFSPSEVIMFFFAVKLRRGWRKQRMRRRRRRQKVKLRHKNLLEKAMFLKVHQKVLSLVVEEGSAEPLVLFPILVSAWIEFWNFCIDIFLLDQSCILLSCQTFVGRFPSYCLEFSVEQIWVHVNPLQYLQLLFNGACLTIICLWLCHTLGIFLWLKPNVLISYNYSL